VGNAVDELADQSGSDQGSQCGQGMQPDHREHGGAVFAQERARVRSHRRHVGDR